MRKLSFNAHGAYLRSAIAVINPGTKAFGKRVQEMVDTLESILKDLESAEKSFDADKDKDEFAQFFSDKAEAEEAELSRLLKSVRAAAVIRQAGISDFFKKFFKKKKPEEEDEVREVDHHLSDKYMDEFVEGKRDLADSSYYIEQEKKQNDAFMDGASKVIEDFKKMKEKPSKALITQFKTRLTDLIESGKRIVKGDYDRGEAGSLDESEAKEEKKGAKGGSLFMTVDHYSDLLRDVSREGDPDKLKKTLKEFLSQVKPHLS